jgi:hypothetical protein
MERHVAGAQLDRRTTGIENGRSLMRRGWLNASVNFDYSATFAASATTDTLAINGTDLNGGDNAVFIDNVRGERQMNFVSYIN